MGRSHQYERGFELVRTHVAHSSSRRRWGGNSQRGDPMLETRQLRPPQSAGDPATDAGPSPFIGESDAFKYVQFRIEQVAPTDATILLLGETGTGKGVVAQAIHQRSRRRAARFVNVNCAALPPTLVESELFGHERGAFTDARATQ